VRLIAKFEDFYNDTLPYMYHCHMLSHEDEGMMGQFIVKSPCNLLKSSPADVSAKVDDNVSFSVEVTDTIGVTYQWQGNTGFGFVDMQNLGQYSGVKTAKLSVSSVSAANNNILFRCVVKNASCEIISNSVLLSVGNTGLENRENGNHISIFPNPSNDYLSINWLGKTTNAVISISDPQGKTVLTDRQINTGELLNLKDLASGIYFITLQINDGQKTFRLVKN